MEINKGCLQHGVGRGHKRVKKIGIGGQSCKIVSIFDFTVKFYILVHLVSEAFPICLLPYIVHVT